MSAKRGRGRSLRAVLASIVCRACLDQLVGWYATAYRREIAIDASLARLLNSYRMPSRSLRSGRRYNCLYGSLFCREDEKRRRRQMGLAQL